MQTGQGAPLEDHKIVQRNLALQREWYGEPLGDRVRRLVVAFDISQAYLADVLGISAPMLSQVMSGRRAKIGNPAVLARLIMLERKILTPGVASGDRSAMQQALDDVRESKPTVDREALPVHDGRPDVAAVQALRRVARPEDLTRAAETVRDHHPWLAELLRRAAFPHL
jgi:transcriptional regulator with XRE-family HTH domain